MSKKKTFTGNTMTLKDFHGGSIPSDLPLPSAPGVIVRPSSDHRQGQGYDRQTTAWGNPANRSVDHRLRPGSSGSMRSNNLSLDDKSVFLSSSVNIGRNFDEDERKPLDGGPSVARRMVSDDMIRGPVVRSEARGDVGRVSVGRESSSLGLGLGSGGNSYSARVVEGGNVGGVGAGVRPNAWSVRKEVSSSGVGTNETVSTISGVGQNTASKFSQASALDQISSGRWQTKPLHQPADVEVIRPSDSPRSLYARESEYFGGGGSGGGFVNEKDFVDASLVRRVEWDLTMDEGVRRNLKDVLGVDRVHSPDVFDGKERSPVLFTNNGQLVCPDGRYDNPETLMPPEDKMPEKPKLKLLPRTKPLGAPESSVVDYKQINTSHSETAAKSYGNGRLVKPGSTSSEASHVKPGLSSSEAANPVAERPKLNLKPRSQPLEQPEDNIDRKRIPLFGGARPREAVLKERGVDDVVNKQDEGQGPSRTRNDIPRTEIAPAHKSSTRHTERVPHSSIEQRTGRGLEKKDKRTDVQKADAHRDAQRDNWRNENWRSVRDTEKQPQQERPPSPETWRKPIQEPKVGDADKSLRFGKAVSAVELAQAFSRPNSDPSPFSGQRLPGRTQIPFSRLTNSTTRPQLNGF